MILTLNAEKLIVNIPVGKDFSWFENQRKVVLSNYNSKYLSYRGKIVERSSSRRKNIFSTIQGQEIGCFKYDFHNNVCYYNNKAKSEITKYDLLLPEVTNFWLNGYDCSKEVRMESLIIDDDSSMLLEEIDFILTCENDVVKRDLLYYNHKQFATMYYEIMPNIELKSISEYPISSLEENIINFSKIDAAKENNKILQLLKK